MEAAKSTRYEIDVAKKALSGTQSICDSNIGLLKNYKESLEKLETRSESSSTRDVFEADIKLIDAHINMVKGHKRHAKRFEDMVTKHQANLEERLWDEGPSWLWESMGKTWERINRLTGQKSLLQPQLKLFKGPYLSKLSKTYVSRLKKMFMKVQEAYNKDDAGATCLAQTEKCIRTRHS
jgi:hypothetical protein